MIEEAVESLRATVLPNFMEPKSKLTKCKPAVDSVYTILEKKMKSRLESHQLNSTGDSASTYENIGCANSKCVIQF